MRVLEPLRQRLARADALLPLALIGVASGVLTGLVIIAFRLLTESPYLQVGPMASGDDFEALAWPYRLALPVLGGLVVGLVFMGVPPAARQLGVVHVMERLAYHAGRLPWRNALLQFFGALLAISSGHSVGREGPAIHVGAASSSLLGQWLRIPNNSIRILVACGTAAAIAASFNTPIAGVIFAMEVVMMEYSLVGFTPVILSAVCATSITRLVYGADSAFNVPAMHMASLWELPYILLVGVALGALASLFIYGVGELEGRTRGIPLWLRTTIAGLITGLCALVAPEVMGIGYDTVEQTLLGEIALTGLVIIVILKLLATTACVGLGTPAGLIGPTLVMGALAGAALGIVGHQLVPEHSASSGFYAMLGMGAMMGATLQAPLAALMCILELTANPNSILPGMIAIVAATLTSRVLFRRESIFIAILKARGLDYRHDPVAVALSRTGVTAVMSRRFTTVPAQTTLGAIDRILDQGPEWVIVARDGRIAGAVSEERLSQVRNEWSTEAESSDGPVAITDEHCDDFVTVRSQATLREALDALDREDMDLVLVTGSSSLDPGGIYGILTRHQIEASVRYRD